MKTFWKISSVLMSVFFLFSCKKDTTNGNGNLNLSCILHSVTENPDSSKSSTHTYEYDNDGRVKKDVTTNKLGKVIQVVNYSYSPSKVVLFDSTLNTTVEEFILNSKGLASSSIRLNSYKYTYDYDSNGFLIHSTENSPNQSLNGNFINNGLNITSGSYIFSDSTSGQALIDTIKFTDEFYQDRKNTKDLKESYHGKPSSNLIKRKIETHSLSKAVIEYRYTYSFDNMGNAITEKRLGFITNNGITTTSENSSQYIYNCK